MTKREIKVFISSTFHDMQDERNHLVHNVFPLLRSMAAERNVVLTEIDLRWGIKQEESETGKTVEICLSEIEGARPFFIGLLGDRYGWVPSQYPRALHMPLRTHMVPASDGHGQGDRLLYGRAEEHAKR